MFDPEEIGAHIEVDHEREQSEPNDLKNKWTAQQNANHRLLWLIVS